MSVGLISSQRRVPRGRVPEKRVAEKRDPRGREPRVREWQSRVQGKERSKDDHSLL